MATLADLLGAPATPANEAIVEKFRADLVRAAQIGGAVSDPPGLPGPVAERIRKEVMSAFYANRPAQQISEPMDPGQAALSYRVNKNLDPKLEAALNDPFNKRTGPVEAPKRGQGFIPSIPITAGLGLADIVAGSLPAAAPRFGLAQMLEGLPAYSSPRLAYARELATNQAAQPNMLGRGFPASSQSSAPVSSTYTIRKGDTLTSIAARTGQSVAAIAAKNGITDPNKIVAGKTLKL